MTDPEETIDAADAAPSNHVPADALRPDMTIAPGERQHWYRIGLTPDAPRSCFHICGLEFVKKSELIALPNRHAGQIKAVRRPRIGVDLRLTVEKLSQLKQKIARTLVRFTGAAVTPTAGVDVGDPLGGRRQCYLTTKPTEEEVAQAKSQRLAYRRWEQRPDDVWVGEYIFVQYLGGDRPTPPSEFDECPEPVSKTGLVFPAEDAVVASPHGGVKWHTNGLNQAHDRVIEAERALE